MLIVRVRYVSIPVNILLDSVLILYHDFCLPVFFSRSKKYEFDFSYSKKIKSLERIIAAAARLT